MMKDYKESPLVAVILVLRFHHKKVTMCKVMELREI